MRTFIVSTGRTGTQSLAYLFSELDSSVLALHEPKPSRRFRLLSNLRACGKASPEFCCSHFTSVRKDYLDSHIHYVESNNFLFGFVDYLSYKLEAKILHVVRHPLDYAKSHMKHGVFRGLKGLASNYIPYWLAQPSKYGVSEVHWRSLPEIERLFWNWRLVNQTILDNCSSLGDRYKVVKYEDIFYDDHALTEVLTWSGLETPPQEELRTLRVTRLNAGKGYAPELPQTNVRRMVDICGPLMTRLGY